MDFLKKDMYIPNVIKVKLADRPSVSFNFKVLNSRITNPCETPCKETNLIYLATC